MSTSQVNISRLKQASSEMEKIYTSLVQNEHLLADIMEVVKTEWQGEAATVYLNAYKQNAPELSNMSKLVQNTSQTLAQIATSYSKQESSVADLIRSTLPKG